MNEMSLEPESRPNGQAGYAERRTAAAAWLVVLLLWPVGFLNYLDRLLITSMREAIEASLPMSEAQFGLLTSIFLWVYGALVPFAGFLADRYSRRRMVIGSLFAWSLFTALTGLAHSYAALFLARAGMGISEACYLPAGLALICDYHRDRTRSRAVGLNASGLYAGTALGGIGGYLALALGWRAGFLLFGAMGILYTLVLLRWLSDPPGFSRLDQGRSRGVDPLGTVRFAPAFRALFATPGYWLLLAGLIPIGFAVWLVYGWLPTYLHEHFKIGLGVSGLSATAYAQVAAIGGLLIGGFWADHWTVYNPRGRVWVAACGCVLAAPALYLMAGTNHLGIAVGALLAFGFGMGCYSANTMPIVRFLVDERYSATGFGLIGGLSCMAGGAMTYAGGALRDHQVDLALTFQLSAGGVLGAGILLFFVKSAGVRGIRLPAID